MNLIIAWATIEAHAVLWPTFRHGKLFALLFYVLWRTDRKFHHSSWSYQWLFPLSTFCWFTHCNFSTEFWELCLPGSSVFTLGLQLTFYLVLDMSNTSIGSSLMQKRNGNLHPIMYTCRKFEINWSFVLGNTSGGFINGLFIDMQDICWTHILFILTDHKGLSILKSEWPWNKYPLRW